MRVASLGDLHITEGPRLEDQRVCLNAVIDEAITKRPDLWIIPGDIAGVSVPHRPTPREREVFEPAIVRMANVAPVVLCSGNHDMDIALKRAEDLAGVWPIHVITGAEVLQISTPSGLANVYSLAYPSKSWLLAGEDAVRGVEAAQTAVEQRLQTLLKLWRARITRGRAADPTSVHIMAAHIQIGSSITSGGEVLGAHEIELSRSDIEGLGADAVCLGHIHKSQQVGLNAHYAGSLWRNSFAETEPKSWNLITIDGGQTTTTAIPSPCRDFVTLRWRWAADKDSGEPRWVEQPDSLDGVQDAEVRAQLVVPDSMASSVPWDAEIERVKAAGAHRIVQERTIEPTVRARAPGLATATSAAERLEVYWSSLESMPIEVERAAALEVLAELEQHDDETIRETTNKVMGGAA